MSLFIWVLDTAVTNGNLAPSKLDSGWVNCHCRFMLMVPWVFVDEAVESRAIGTSIKVRNYVIHTTSSRRIVRAGGYATGFQKPKPSVMRRVEQNISGRVDDVGRRLFLNCRHSEKVSSSAFIRSSCRYFHCLVPERNCFLNLHQEALDLKLNKNLNDCFQNLTLI